MCGTYKSMHMDVSANVCVRPWREENHWSKLVELNHHWVTHCTRTILFAVYLFFAQFHSGVGFSLSFPFISFHHVVREVVRACVDDTSVNSIASTMNFANTINTLATKTIAIYFDIVFTSLFRFLTTSTRTLLSAQSVLCLAVEVEATNYIVAKYMAKCSSSVNVPKHINLDYGVSDEFGWWQMIALRLHQCSIRFLSHHPPPNFFALFSISSLSFYISHSLVHKPNISKASG